MEYNLTSPAGKKLSIGSGVLTYSVTPGSPLWIAIESDDLPLVQNLANGIVQSGIHIFSVSAAMLDGQGQIVFGNILGLACHLKAVETAVWLYKQIPSFLSAKNFEMSMRGFVSIIETPSADPRLIEISRRCVEWSFMNFHECRIKSGAPLQSFGSDCTAASLYMDIGMRMQAAHEKKVLGANTPSGRPRPRWTSMSPRL